MKHLLLATTAAIMLCACATSDTSDKMMADDSEKMMTDESMMETETTMEDDTMMDSEPVIESESMMTDKPAPAASVDCTGLSDDECIAKVMNFGKAPAPAEAAPVEPVEMEPIMNDAAATPPEG